jgi:putative transposase
MGQVLHASATTTEAVRRAIQHSQETYNTTWLIERHGFISPADFRQTGLQPAAKAA